jgi:replicative DNA helicase
MEFSHISRYNKEAVRYIHNRKLGIEKSLKTGFNKLDKALLDGIEWGRIFTVAAMSGSGKSVFLEQLKRQIIDLNKEEKIKVLSFEFEMPSREQVLRNLSGKLKIPVNKLLSAEEELSDKAMELVEIAAGKMSRYPIYTVETPGTVEQIGQTMNNFVKYHHEGGNDMGFIFTIDHVLLTQGRTGEEERKIIAALYRMSIALKKKWAKEGVKVLFVYLSQLNRAIEMPDRVLNEDLQFPTRADLFGSSDIFMCSDYVLVIHKPAILGLRTYGPPRKGFEKGLPIWNPKNSQQAMIYFHLLKQRTGEPKILSMLDNFRFSEIIEYEN